MALVYLTLDALRELDGGRVATAFQEAMKRIVADCEDRPGEERPRKLSLEATFVPQMGEDGNCSGVGVEFQVKDTIPNRRSKKYGMGIKNGGRVFFSTEDPTNVDQYTIDEVDPKTGRVRREAAAD